MNKTCKKLFFKKKKKKKKKKTLCRENDQPHKT